MRRASCKGSPTRPSLGAPQRHSPPPATRLAATLRHRLGASGIGATMRHRRGATGEGLGAPWLEPGAPGGVAHGPPPLLVGIPSPHAPRPCAFCITHRCPFLRALAPREFCTTPIALGHRQVPRCVRALAGMLWQVGLVRLATTARRGVGGLRGLYGARDARLWQGIASGHLAVVAYSDERLANDGSGWPVKVRIGQSQVSWEHKGCRLVTTTMAWCKDGSWVPPRGD